jgi:hypothetical protein
VESVPQGGAGHEAKASRILEEDRGRVAALMEHALGEWEYAALGLQEELLVGGRCGLLSHATW